MIDLAIVIVSYNVSNLLRRCLRSVYASQGELTYRICVVDNNSPDESVAMVRSEFPQVDLIANAENRGYPAANNQGLRFLGVDAEDIFDRPRYSLLLNPDTEVPPDAFSQLVRFMDQNSTIGIIGPKLVLPDGSLDLACRRGFPTPEVSFYRMVGLSRLFPRSRRFGRYNMTYLDENSQTEVDAVVGAFMMLRQEAINDVGLLDESFWMYGEDLDWAKRIKDRGWKVVYYPKVVVLHVKRASSKGSERARLEFDRAMLIFYYKHYYNQTPLILHWIVILGIWLRGGRQITEDIRSGPEILTKARKTTQAHVN